MLFANNIVAIECPLLLFVKPIQHEKWKQSKKRGRSCVGKNWCDRSVWFISDTYVKLPVRPPQRPLSLLRGSAVVVAVICQGSWIARNKRSKKEDIVRTFFVRSDQFRTILLLLTQHPSHHHSRYHVLVLPPSLLLSLLLSLMNNKKQEIKGKGKEKYR